MKTWRAHAVALLAAAAVLGGCRTASSPAGANAPQPLRIGISTGENEADRLVRWEPFRLYLARRLQRPVELRSATDYAGVIEALRAKQLDLAQLGAAAYARAWLLTQGAVRPLATALNEDGESGYYSVIEVRADSPYRTIADLKGKTLAFADPNSTSGYVAPAYFLTEQGSEPKAHFARTIFAGSHEGAVLAVVNRTCDAAATWAYGDTRTNAARMAGKGMIPRGSTRTVWRSPELPTTAWTVRRDLPEPLQQALRGALVSFAADDAASFAVVGKGRETGYVAADHARYEPVIRMVRDSLAARRAE